MDASTESLFSTRALFPYLHLLFSLPLLLAIGYAVFLPTVSRRFALVFVGWLGTLALHAIWNWEVYFGETSMSIAPWYRYLPEASPFVVLVVLLLVYLAESRALARGGIQVPGPFQRFRGTDASAIRRAQTSRFRRFLKTDPSPDADQSGTLEVSRHSP